MLAQHRQKIFIGYQADHPARRGTEAALPKTADEFAEDSQ